MFATVLGASGFIGSHLVTALRARGIEVWAPSRGDAQIFARPLGHVFYCIGMTANFRQRPFDTVEAHVCLLKRVLHEATFKSLLYLSSTRVYSGAAIGREGSRLLVDPGNPTDLYNLTKLTAESLCMSDPRHAVRVARLSNVYGPDFKSENFLSSLICAALDGAVYLQSALDSAKDYISVADVVHALINIDQHGQQRLYNIAAGCNVTNRALLAHLEQLTGCRTDVAKDAAMLAFPIIDITRLSTEFDYRPAALLSQLPELLKLYRQYLTSRNDENDL